MPDKKNIVILGAGFGGFRAAYLISKQLRRLKLGWHYRVILIDRNDYQTYTPTLYEIATTSQTTANHLELKEIVTFSVYESILGQEIEFIKTEVQRIDTIGGDIHCANGQRIRFDYLLLALGSEPNFFGIPGLKEYAFTLKSFIDALRIRDQITLLVNDPEERHLKIVVGGAGPTGVELAAELKMWLCNVRTAPRPGCSAEVSIIDSGQTVLAPFGPGIAKRAERRLKKLGVNIIAGERVAELTPDKVKLVSGKEIPCDLFVWTGGVKPNHLMSEMQMKLEPKSKRVVISSDMVCLPESEELKFYGKIYAIGDVGCFINPKTGVPVPGTARAAISQATIASHNIIEEIKTAEEMTETPALKKYRPMNYPYIIPVGGKFAIARVGRMIFSRLPGWIFKGLVEFNYLISILPIRLALKLWLKGLRIYIKNDNLG